jgi:muramoyltetrapeptide carboxypeptidase
MSGTDDTTSAAGSAWGIYSPSGFVADSAAVDRAVVLLNAHGHRVEVDAAALARHQRFAGTDAERIEAVGRIARNAAIDVAIATRGGYGWTRLLDDLDYRALAASGKRWLGHSDFTAFALAMLAHAGAVTYAGPMATYDFGATTPSEFTLRHCFGLLDEHEYECEIPLDGADAQFGPAVVWGGNLALVAHLVGSRHFPRIDGGILFLEDVGEHPYRVERMLYQLLRAGVLARQRAILLGAFTEYELTPNDGGYDLPAAIAQLRTEVPTPIYTGLPFGHVRDKLTLPVGGHCALSVRHGAGRLVFSNYAARP